MQGQKRFSPKLFYDISLEGLVPEDHVVRRFDSLLSLDFLYEETKAFYSHTGQPSVDPVVLFKMMLLGYLFGISSERKLASEMRVNLAFRWYLGYDLDEATPNHSVLSKARSRFPEEVFAGFFRRVVQLCVGAGLVRGETVCLDSTLIRANASLDSFVEVKEVPETFIKRVYAENDFDPAEPLARDGTVGRHYDGKTDPRKMGRRRQRCFVNSKMRSRTDPEASIVYRPGTGRQAAFKGHVAVDSESRVITSVTVSTGSADDTTAVDSLVQDHIRQVGHWPHQVVADSHYGTSEVYNYLAHQGIAAVIRPRRTRHRPGFLTADDFTYDKGKDCYICPRGAVLKLKGYQRTVHRKAYVADKAVCDRCPLRATCTTSRQHGRMITRFIDDYFEQADRMVNSERGQQLLRQRQTAIEGVFGEAKSFHLLRRALFRGTAKLKIQVLLTATVLNLKRLMRQHLPTRGALQSVSGSLKSVATFTPLITRLSLRPATS
jgi:transposase